MSKLLAFLPVSDPVARRLRLLSAFTIVLFTPRPALVRRKSSNSADALPTPAQAVAFAKPLAIFVSSRGTNISRPRSLLLWTAFISRIPRGLDDRRPSASSTLAAIPSVPSILRRLVLAVAGAAGLPVIRIHPAGPVYPNNAPEIPQINTLFAAVRF